MIQCFRLIAWLNNDKKEKKNLTAIKFFHIITLRFWNIYACQPSNVTLEEFNVSLFGLFVSSDWIKELLNHKISYYFIFPNQIDT